MLILICGLPNAGKTTYSQQFTNVLHLDDFPFSKFLNCNEAVKSIKGDVIVEGIYNMKCRRLRLLESYSGKKKICILIDTPLEECLQRNGRSSEIVMRDYQTFQPPTYNEGWDEIYIIRNGKKELLPKEDK